MSGKKRFKDAFERTIACLILFGFILFCIWFVTSGMIGYGIGMIGYGIGMIKDMIPTITVGEHVDSIDIQPIPAGFVPNDSWVLRTKDFGITLSTYDEVMGTINEFKRDESVVIVSETIVIIERGGFLTKGYALLRYEYYERVDEHE